MVSDGRKPFQAARNFVVGLPQSRDRSAQDLGFLLAAAVWTSGNDGNGCAAGICRSSTHREILVEVGEHKNGDSSRLRFISNSASCKSSLLLVGLNLSLDDIRVRDLAAVLELLTDVEEPLRLSRGSLHGRVFSVAPPRSRNKPAPR